MIIKRIASLTYYIVFFSLVLNFTDDLIHTKTFTFISQSSYWNIAAGAFLIYLFLSIISLFNRKIIFAYVPYIFYILYLLVTVLTYLLNANEDLK